VIRLTDVAKSAVQSCLRPGDIAIDATVGNGHDTRFLVECVGATGRVYGFDLQPAALKATALRLDAAGLAPAVLCHASHARMRQTLPDLSPGTVGVVMFNLGYLPGGDKQFITRVDSTLAALEDALMLLKPGGLVTVISYPGHTGGDEELAGILGWLERLDRLTYPWSEPVAPHSASAPRLFLIPRASGSTVVTAGEKRLPSVP